MPDKYPVTERTDVSPSKNSWPEAKHGESFEHAANRPNDPKKPIDFNAGPYNVNDNYCQHEDNDEY
jgi:hypothetical protein